MVKWIECKGAAVLSVVVLSQNLLPRVEEAKSSVLIGP